MLLSLVGAVLAMQNLNAEIVDHPVAGRDACYPGSRAPLQPTPLVKLPITAFEPGGWLRRNLELQRDGLTGELGEVSIWLTKENNAWLNPEGTGEWGWEEVPYWLRGYSRIGYALGDEKMIAETKVWIEAAFNSVRPNGDFGPIHNHRKGFRDLWAQMIMLQVLQGWYEYSSDPRVIDLMTGFFRWELEIPDEEFLKDYWESARGGDNLSSVYWLYNITGEPFLLDLADKIHRNTLNWRLSGRLPDYHNVNIAQGFREPATWWLQSGNSGDLAASYRNQAFIREKYGQVPGGMFGSDEDCRPGHDDPHQGVETCGMVEQLLSNQQMSAITGDPAWITNSEDVAFNTLPASFTPDYRALRYFTAPNLAVSDKENHSPGIQNKGPFFLMNPFSSRCCQHNHTSGWVNFLEQTWMASADQGLAALTYTEGAVTAKVAGGTARIETRTRYPFEGTVELIVTPSTPEPFPIYLRIPEWAEGAHAVVGGVHISAEPGKFLRLEKVWSKGEAIQLILPMTPRVKVWDQMKDAVSVEYGPLTFSLEIEEEYRGVNSQETAIYDSRWQPGADPEKWPSYEILPKSPWNYALAPNPKLTVVRGEWPRDNEPFKPEGTSIRIETQGHIVRDWTLDQDGLAGVLPKSPVLTDTPAEPIRLIPMGAARLRISSFPVAGPKGGVLMIHGAGGGGWEYDFWKPIWEEAGFKVAAPDLMPVEAGLAETKFEDYVKQVVDAARDLPKPVILVGASMGGILAIKAAEQIDVDAIVLINSVSPAGVGKRSDRPPLPPIIEWANGPIEDTRASLPDGDEATIQWAHPQWRDESGAVLNAIREGIEARPPKVPVLVVIGSDDTDITPEQSRALAKWAKADVLEFAGVSHIGPLMGRRRAEIARTVADWVKTAIRAGS